MADPENTADEMNTLHPLAADVVAVFEQSAANPKFVFNDAHLFKLSEGLAGLFESQALAAAVSSLLGVARGFERQGLHRPAKQLFDLLAEKPLLDALDQVDAAREAATRDAVAESSEKFKNFRGDTTQRSAPRVGEQRPDGTLSLDKLSFPKRL